MEVKNHLAQGFIAKPPKDLRAALVYGPDAGLVRERADALAKTVVADLTDPFNVADLSEATLDADPARLFDEAQAISMMGGRRVVRVRGAGNGLAEICERFLAELPGDALVVVEAGDLAKSAALRKLFDGDAKAAAIACYPDSARDLPDVVRDALRAEGLSIAPDALAEAASRLGVDRGVTRRELEKLLLYMHGQKQVTLEDVQAVMGDEAELRAESAVEAAGGGDFARLDREVERLWSADTAPAMVIRSAMSHFQKLLTARAAMAQGEPMDVALRRLRPPLHFSRAAAFKAQAERWSVDKLGEALDMLLEAEALSRTTGVPAEAVTGRTLMNIAALAKGRM
jgi:DNA polymerase-3 subunit delta